MTGIGWTCQAPETNEEIGKDGDSRKLGVTSRKKSRSRSHKSRSNRRIETGELLIGHRSKGTNGASLRAQISRCDRWKVSAEFLFGGDRTGTEVFAAVICR